MWKAWKAWNAWGIFVQRCGWGDDREVIWDYSLYVMFSSTGFLFLVSVFFSQLTSLNAKYFLVGSRSHLNYHELVTRVKFWLRGYSVRSIAGSLTVSRFWEVLDSYFHCNVFFVQEGLWTANYNHLCLCYKSWCISSTTRLGLTVKLSGWLRLVFFYLFLKS